MSHKSVIWIDRRQELMILCLLESVKLETQRRGRVHVCVALQRTFQTFFGLAEFLFDWFTGEVFMAERNGVKDVEHGL